MTDDEALQQVWAAKEAFARRFNYDLQAMGDYLRAKQEEEGYPVVRRAPRRPEGWVPPPTEPVGTTSEESPGR